MPEKGTKKKPELPQPRPDIVLPDDVQTADYLQSLPTSDRITLAHSNLTFHSADDVKSYLADNSPRADAVLYQQLPEPAIPSNAAYDPLDSTDP